MLILTLRTNKPESEIALWDDQKLLVDEKWEAHRQLAETIHRQIEKLLQSQQKDWQDLEGLVVYKGPGSYTGLRIGMSVANALATGLAIPVIATNDRNWQPTGTRNILDGQNQTQVVPEYGADAFTTQPKK